MLLTNFKPDRAGKKPLYLQVADFIKEQIRLGQVTPGMRLPSVRDLSAALHLSRTTTETCYSKLTAEGYLVSKPQSGYFVADLQLPKQLPRELLRAARGRPRATISPTTTSTGRPSRPSSGAAISARRSRKRPP